MIRAELDEALAPPGTIFSRRPRATALGIEAVASKGDAVVCNLCRKLVEAGHDPNSPMEVYRGSTLALHVRSIGEAAKLSVDEQGPYFIKWKNPRTRGYVGRDSD